MGDPRASTHGSMDADIPLAAQVKCPSVPFHRLCSSTPDTLRLCTVGAHVLAVNWEKQMGLTEILPTSLLWGNSSNQQA